MLGLSDEYVLLLIKLLAVEFLVEVLGIVNSSGAFSLVIVVEIALVRQELALVVLQLLAVDECADYSPDIRLLGDLLAVLIPELFGLGLDFFPQIRGILHLDEVEVGEPLGSLDSLEAFLVVFEVLLNLREQDEDE